VETEAKTLLEKYLADTQSQKGLFQDYWPDAKALGIEPCHVIAIGYVRFHSDTGCADSIEVAVSKEEGNYYISTNYRNVGKTKIDKIRALELRDRFESNVSRYYPHRKCQYLYEEGSKRAFFTKYFGWDDSYRGMDVYSAVNEIWLDYKYKEALNALNLPEPVIDTEILINRFFEIGKLVGTEFMRIPKISVLMSFINEVRALNNFHFECGFKEGLLLNSPLPDVEVDNGELKKLTEEIISNSKDEFLHNCSNRSGDFGFPIDKETANKSQLLKVISDYLPMANDMCDGTSHSSLVNEQVGSAIIDQARNTLVCQGYVFSEKERAMMRFLEWPVTHEEARAQAMKTLSSPMLQQWEKARDYEIYGERGRRYGEELNALKTFIACLKGQANSTNLNPENIFVEVNRHSNDAIIVDKNTLNRLAERLRETCGNIKYSRVVGVEPAPLIFKFWQHGVGSSTPGEHDSLTFWHVTCSPSDKPEFWETLLELFRISGSSIVITPRDGRFCNFEVVIKQITSKTITVGYKTVRYDIPLSDFDF